jgi:hypothetical protein
MTMLKINHKKTGNQSCDYPFAGKNRVLMARIFRKHQYPNHLETLKKKFRALKKGLIFPHSGRTPCFGWTNRLRATGAYSNFTLTQRPGKMRLFHKGRVFRCGKTFRIRQFLHKRQLNEKSQDVVIRIDDP